MTTLKMNNWHFSWQINLALVVGCISAVNIIFVNVFSLVELRNSIWTYTFPFVHICSCIVTLNTGYREKIARRKAAWIFISTGSFFSCCQFLFRSLSYDDTFIVIGIFIFITLGLIVYFPKNIWNIGNIWRVIFDIILLSFAFISIIQSLIYYYFGAHELAIISAPLAIWIGFEIAGLVNTIFLWKHHQQRILGLIVLVAICIVLADVTGMIRRWIPMYRVSGLPNISFNYLHSMILMIFAYYSVDHFRDFASGKKHIISRFEWIYRTGVPRFAFIISLAVTVFIHPPDLWIMRVLFGVAVVQALISVNEEYHLIEQLFQTNNILQIAQTQLRLALINAEDLAVAEERKRLTLEIHDGMSHHLTNAKRYCANAVRLIERDLLQAKEYLMITASEIGKAHIELRRSLQALTTDVIMTQPLETWMQSLLNECRYVRITGELQVIGVPRTLPPNIQHTLYRVAQEAFTNVKKHAYARHIWVKMIYAADYLEMHIQDDGIGIEEPDNIQGHGTNNMRARIEQIGGELQIASSFGQGVTIRATIPIH